MKADDRKDYRSLGEIFRDARNERNQSIEDVSSDTKISPRMLMALEADDFDQIADPVYAKSFVRNLAENFGLDPAWLLTKMQTANPEPPRPQVPVSPALTAKRAPDVNAARAERAAAQTEEDATTWHIEDVRVRKVTADAPRGPGARTWITVAVVALVAVASWWILRSTSSEDARPDRASTEVADQDRSQPPLQQGNLSPSPQPAVEGSTAPSEEDVPVSTDEEFLELSPPLNQSPPPASKPVEEVATSTTAPVTGSNANATNPPTTPAPTKPKKPVDEVVSVQDSGGLASIVRQGGEDAVRAPMKLVITAKGRVDVWVAADGGQRHRRILVSGQEWESEGRDHFSLQFSDVNLISVTLDGVRRDPPTGLEGEWILYPAASPR